MSLGNSPAAALPSGIRLFVRVFLPFAFGYFLSYLYRTVNAVIAPELVADVGLDAAGLGLLTAAYFITFAAIQLPLGVVLDSHGPRRVESVLLVIAAGGALLFSIGETPWALIVARGLIGVGVAACLMAALKAMADWYAAEKLPLMNGLIVAAGGLGAVMATAPTKFVVAELGWRSGFEMLAFVTVVAALLLWFVAPDRPRTGPRIGMRELLAGVDGIFRSRKFWLIAPVASTSQGAFLAIQTLWSGPWLRDVAGHDADRVAQVLLISALGFVFGNVASGLFAVWIGRRGVPTPVVLLVGMGIFMLVQLIIIAGWTAHTEILWFVFGFTGTTGILAFAVLTRAFPIGLAGRASTAMNLLLFATAFAMQWGIGIIIDLWPVDAAGGYHPQGYQVAFGVMLLFQAASFVGLLYGHRELVPDESETR